MVWLGLGQASKMLAPSDSRASVPHIDFRLLLLHATATFSFIFAGFT